MIYLDNAATTPPLDEVITAMKPWFHSGNPSSIHPMGRKARDAVEEARASVAKFLEPGTWAKGTVVFTSGGSEANSLAVRGAADHMLRLGLARVAYSNIEHKSVVRAMESICVDYAFKRTELPVSDGRIIFGDNFACNDIGLVSIMARNNETGVYNTDTIRDAGCFVEDDTIVHCDCVQAPIEAMNCIEGGANIVTISGHKMGATQGVGVLWTNIPEELSPIIYGGAQERGLRGGTENVAAIVGLGKACELYRKKHYEYRRELWEFVDSIKASLSTANQRRFHLNQCEGNIVSFRVDNIDAETFVLLAGTYGLCISSGAACNSRSSNPSGALLSAGLTPKQAGETLRLSFSPFGTKTETFKEASVIIAQCIEMLSNS